MAQDIQIAGATFNAVPSIVVPVAGGGSAMFVDPSPTTAAAADVASGKLFFDALGVLTQGTASGGGGGAISIVDTPDSAGGTVRTITAVDISGDTVTAAHLEQGYTAHDAEGNPITGTLSPGGGGGGLEYEAGTWTPAENLARPTINFANAHSTLPVFLMMSDATGTTDQTNSTNYGFLYGSFKTFAGEGVPSDATANRRYGLAGYVYRTSTGTNPQQAISGITELTGSSSFAQEYWVTTTGFMPSSDYNTRYWRTGRTYKWIAVWVPTA